MADAKTLADPVSSGNESKIKIVLDARSSQPPTLDEARLVFSWLETELLDLFKDSS